MNKLNNYIGDELAHKVKILSQALVKAEKIIEVLEEENSILKDALINFTSKDSKSLNNDTLCV